MLPLARLLINELQIIVAEYRDQNGLFVAELLTFSNALCLHLTVVVGATVLALAHVLHVSRGIRQDLGVVRIQTILEHVEESKHIVQAEHCLLGRLLSDKVGGDTQLSADVDGSRGQHAIEVLAILCLRCI